MPELWNVGSILILEKHDGSTSILHFCSWGEADVIFVAKCNARKAPNLNLTNFEKILMTKVKWHELRRQLCLWSSLKQDVVQKFKKYIPKNQPEVAQPILAGWSFRQIFNILYSDNHNKNYLAATAWLLLCCCTAISHHRPVFLFSPVHHFHEELHQLLLDLQVVVSSQVLVCLTLC